ncbi:hypothetical protein [Streptomyces cyaneofuscatus]
MAKPFNLDAFEQATARTEQTEPAAWPERLPELAVRLLDGDATGAVIA